MNGRVQLVRERNLCLGCLEAGHGVANCPSSKKCGIDGCKSNHHRLLHNAPRIFPAKMGSSSSSSRPAAPPAAKPPPPPTLPPVSVPTCGATTVAKRLVLLPIVPVVVTSGGRSLSTFALLDSGSEVTMISEVVKKKLGLTGPAEDTRIGSWHSQDPSFKSTRVNFQVGSLDGISTFDITAAYSVPPINLSKRYVDYGEVTEKWPHLASVPLTHTEAAEVMLLIGTDHGDALEILEYRKDSLKASDPHAVWLDCYGKCSRGAPWRRAIGP